MPWSCLAELTGVRRIAVRLDRLGRDAFPDLSPDAEVFLGQDRHGAGIEVLVARWVGVGAPSRPVLRKLHEWRKGRRACPLVTVVRSVETNLLRDQPTPDARPEWLPGYRPGSLPETSEAPPVLVLGPETESNPVSLAESQALSMARAALEEESGAMARRRFVGLKRSLDLDVGPWTGTGANRRPSRGRDPGVAISGLFSSHYVLDTLPREERWRQAGERGRRLLPERGQELIRSLGFRVAETAAQAHVLAGENGELRAVAVLLDLGETFEAESGRFRQSPAAYGLTKARQRNIRWLILMRGAQIRLYSAEAGVGVGSRSRVETWFELDLAALDEDRAAYLDLVFTAAALARAGTVDDLLAKSRQFAADLGARLRQRIYERVVPGLAVGVAEALDRQGAAEPGSPLDRNGGTRPPLVRNGAEPGGEQAAGRSTAGGSGDLVWSYRLSLRILFRLLFQAYAEDRDLLPYGRNSEYDRHSLKQRAVDLADRARRRAGEPATTSGSGSLDQAFDAGSTTLWSNLQTIWKAIDRGDSDLDVPAYNGGLFDDGAGNRGDGDRQRGDLGTIALSNDVIGPALRDLLVDETPDRGGGTEEGTGKGATTGPVDFRSLSVREFGTIYEGLLESELSRAETDLAVDRKGAYRPCQAGDEVVVRQGEVYFHNRSGERKATGSYFTPEFAVEHLLQQALEPALGNHLAKVAALHDAGDEASAAEAFWDFRVADIAMGSGHFLIAALDRMETAMHDFLTERPLPEVTAELERLERKAREATGAANSNWQIERHQLLRRQIARRCIYGVDLNETAVELARVAVWIHTFVPGLPISTLDHNLVCADSLTGIGSVDEALDVLDPDRGERQTSLYSASIVEAMRSAVTPLLEQAKALEADTAEVLRSRERLREAEAAAEPARLLFDAAVAARLDLAEIPGDRSVKALQAVARRPDVAAAMRAMKPAHMPVLFPEVFTRERPGFDVLTGNPPWEEATVEELGFWASRFPGLKSLRQKEQLPEIERLREERPDLIAQLVDEKERAERRRQALLAGPYPGMGAGDPDLYKAFCWRYWHLVREGGAVGVVLPRSALAAKGAKEWRLAVLDGGAFADVTLLLNKGRWVFDMEPRYTVGLVSFRKGADHERILSLRGPYDSLNMYEAGLRTGSANIPVEEFLNWSDSAALPSISSDAALGVFLKMRRHPRLDLPATAFSARGSSKQRATGNGQRATGNGQRATGNGQRATGNGCNRFRDDGAHSSRISRVAGAPGYGTPRDERQTPVPPRHTASWRARPHRELDATNDKGQFTTMTGRLVWPVYGGRSFNLWQPDTGDYYALADPQPIAEFLQKRRLRSHRNRRSAFSEFSKDWAADPQTLPCFEPRIAFRDVTNRTNNRTVVAALVPGERVITNQAPFVAWPVGTPADQAYLLGILSSMIFDWFGRCVIELHLNLHIFNSLPIPRPADDDPFRLRVIEIAGRLATAEPDHKGFREWAQAVGVEAGSIRSEAEKEDLIAELDAVVAHLYGLDEADLAVIYDTFHAGADYSERHAQVLGHFRDQALAP